MEANGLTALLSPDAAKGGHSQMITYALTVYP
jgi:hypothetical protein